MLSASNSPPLYHQQFKSLMAGLGWVCGASTTFSGSNTGSNPEGGRVIKKRYYSMILIRCYYLVSTKTDFFFEILNPFVQLNRPGNHRFQHRWSYWQPVPCQHHWSYVYHQPPVSDNFKQPRSSSGKKLNFCYLSFLVVIGSITW